MALSTPSLYNSPEKPGQTIRLEDYPDHVDRIALIRPYTDVKHFKTGKGSIYNYLPDGSMIREKVATSEVMEPSSVTVFLPDFDWIKEHFQNAPIELKKLLLESPESYKVTTLSYIHGVDCKIYIVDQHGKKIEKNGDFPKEEVVFAAFAHNNKVAFALPVAKSPVLGFRPLDRHKFRNQDGQLQSRTHIGNPVTEIEFK